MALSKIDVANMLTGEVPNANVATIGVAKGGTGLTSRTSGQFLKFTGSTTLASAADNAGKVLQVKSDHTTATLATSSTGFTHHTGIDLSITPTSSSSKILIHFSSNGDNEAAGRQPEIGLWRDIDGANNTVIGGNSMSMFYGVGSRIVVPIAYVYVDSPATTGVVRYRAVCKSNGGNQVLFGAYMGSNTSLTLMEVTHA